MNVGDNNIDVLSISPCGRWEKRNKQFSLREFPCMYGAHLAMDTEEGTEVVWIEIHTLEGSRRRLDSVRALLDTMIRFSHPNLVKLHDYWIDWKNEGKEPVIVIITESLTCGSVSQFVKKNKLNEKPIGLSTWKRWCRQILLGLAYLHSRLPPFVLCNLSCENMFIQHNGLVKIALVHSLCPDDMKFQNVKDGGGRAIFTRATDIAATNNPQKKHPNLKRLESNIFVDFLAFGMVSLYIASMETFQNHFSPTLCSEEKFWTCFPVIQEIVSKLKVTSELQADFIVTCLRSRPHRYPSIPSLLNHPLLFQVPSLMLLSGHYCVKNIKRNAFEDTIDKWDRFYDDDPERVVAKIHHYRLQRENRPIELISTTTKLQESNPIMNIKKFIDEIVSGMHPISCVSNENDMPPENSGNCRPSIINQIFIELLLQSEGFSTNSCTSSTLGGDKIDTGVSSEGGQNNNVSMGLAQNCDLAATATVSNKATASMRKKKSPLFISKIKCHVSRSFNVPTRLVDHTFHDSNLFTKIKLCDNSSIRFVIGFNRGNDAPSSIVRFIPAIQKTLVFEDKLLIKEAVSAAIRYDARIICVQSEPPPSLENSTLEANNT